VHRFVFRELDRTPHIPDPLRQRAHFSHLDAEERLGRLRVTEAVQRLEQRHTTAWPENTVKFVERALLL